ncbi:MAG: hypothetical protein ACFFE4_10915 [Candidatus Thorarchaeota archaeon]
MPIKEGWELSPDRHEKFEKMMSTDPIGDPIITSKCMLDRDNGLLVVSDNGFAWRVQAGMSTSMYSMGKSKWVRWHDVANFIPKKPGFILAEVKVRKKGALETDKKGNIKTKRWRLIVRSNKNEPKDHFKQRAASFYDVMMEIFNQYKTDENPPESDSRI